MKNNLSCKPPDSLQTNVSLVEMAKKILVIENSPETRKLFLECLEANGFLTISAEDGLIGVQRVHEDLPDVIISEIDMPKLDGYKVLTKLGQNPNTAIIPFIFVTAKATCTDMRKGIEMGADDYLFKPCTTEELLRAIAACLKKRATLLQWYATQSHPVPEPLEDSIFPSNPLLSKVFQFIEANYHRPINLSDVAITVGYSPAYLTNLVRRQTGQTVQNWIIERRMTAARFLLLETDKTMKEIAAKVGYQSAVNFFRQFRKYHLATPQVWRRSQLY